LDATVGTLEVLRQNRAWNQSHEFERDLRVVRSE